MTFHDSRAADSEGAITAARSLLESVCKHILDAASVTYDDSADLHSDTASSLVELRTISLKYKCKFPAF